MSYEKLKTNLNQLLEIATEKDTIDLLSATLAQVELAQNEFNKVAEDNVKYAKAYKAAILAKALPAMGVAEEKGGDPTLKPEVTMPDFDKILADKLKGK